MIVAITIILIVAMLCGTVLTYGYWSMIYDGKINEYTLRNVRDNTEEIKADIEMLKKLHEQYVERCQKDNQC